MGVFIVFPAAFNHCLFFVHCNTCNIVFDHLSGKQMLLQQKHSDTNYGVPFLCLRADVSEHTFTPVFSCKAKRVSFTTCVCGHELGVGVGK